MYSGTRWAILLLVLVYADDHDHDHDKDHDKDTSSEHLYFRYSNMYWNSTGGRWTKSLTDKNLDVFECANECTREHFCRSYTHCEENKYCLLMDIMVPPDKAGGIPNKDTTCNTFAPVCWISFSREMKNEPKFEGHDVYKASTADIRGENYNAFKLKDGCSVMFYRSAHFAGPGKEYTQSQPVSSMGEFSSFALYENSNSGWWPNSERNSELYWLLVILGCWGVGSVFCIGVCMICPKCQY